MRSSGTHLYPRVCPLVNPSVRPSVRLRLSITPVKKLRFSAVFGPNEIIYWVCFYFQQESRLFPWNAFSAWTHIYVGNDLVVLFHRVKIEMRSKKNSPPELSTVLAGSNHHRSRRSWFCSTEIRFLSPSALTKRHYLNFLGAPKGPQKSPQWDFFF